MMGPRESAGGAVVADVTFRYSSGPDEIPTGTGIDDVSFTAGPGTVTLLCGPSGSGKTTALRLLNGLIPHFHHGELTGRATVDGFDVAAGSLDDVVGRSATVFQNPRTQFFTPTVMGDLAFGPENTGTPPEEIRRRIASAAAATGTEDLLDRSLRELSGGELQRVACASALVSGARTVLFDEPTSNLSPAGIEQLGDVIAGLKASGHTIVIAEHRLSFLRDLADRVVLLRDGRVTGTFDGAEFFAMPDARRREAGLRSLRPVTAQAPPPPRDAGGKGISLRGVRFHRGRRGILDIDRLHFPAGSVTAVTGPNGIGKTTLARLLCGLETPDKGGDILVDGTPAGTRRLRREGYVVMQDTGRQLFSESVAGEILLGLDPERRRGLDVDAVLAEFDLAHLGDRHPLSLSGGQRQRLVIASASVQDKRVHILDEPTSGVGLEHLTTIAGHMRRMADAGAAVIVITHDAELIDACADYVADLSDPAINHYSPEGAPHGR